MADEIPGLESREADSGKQLKRILRAAKEHRFRLIVFSAIGMILGGFVATLVPDLYESKTLLLLRERRLIDDSSLMKAIEEKPLAQKEQTLEQELRSYAWIVEVLKRVEWIEYANIRHDPAKVKDLVEKVRDPKHLNVDVSTDPAGELLVEIIFKWFHPRQTHDFVRAARKNWITHRDEESQAYWRQQLTVAESIVRERRDAYEKVAFAREKFMSENNLSLLNDVNADASLKVQLVTERARYASEKEELETRLQSLQERLDNLEPFLVTETEAPNPEYEAAKQAYETGESALRSLLEQKTETHPDVIKAREAVAQAKVRFDALEGQEFLPTQKDQLPNDAYTELKKAIELDTPRLQGLKNRLLSLDLQIREVNDRLDRLPTLQNTLQKLTNDFEVAQNLLNVAQEQIAPLRDKVAQYEARTTKLFSDSEEELQATGAFEILEDPVIPDSPVGLPKPVFSLIGLLVGLALALALALLGEVTRSTYDDAGEVQSTLRLPVLGAINRIATETELRRERLAEVVRMAGSMLIVVSLGVVVYVVTSHPDMLPLQVQDALQGLRTNFR
ncbi:MAG: hypothetical protein ACF8XB_17305 [Planctomycetota bacterium JB042]